MVVVNTQWQEVIHMLPVGICWACS